MRGLCIGILCLFFATGVTAGALSYADHHVPLRVWNALAQCETGGNWQHRTRDYQGGLGFYRGSWDAYRYPGMPSEAYLATKRQQIKVAHRILLDVGWVAWPACSIRLGLR